MDQKNSIVDLGGLAKPITALIEKTASAIGVLYEPKRIKNKARAEAEAALETQAAALGITGIELRAFKKTAFEERRKQIAIEDVLDMTTGMLNPDSKPEELNEDWLINFFDKVRLATTDEMKTIWAKILADQSNEPGKFSKRAVNILSSLDANDVSDFMKLSRFGVIYDGTPTAVILDIEHEIYKTNEINFDLIFNLEAVGLIQYAHSGAYTLTRVKDDNKIYYFDESFEYNDKGSELYIGKVTLTKVGIELFSISNPDPVTDFFEYLESEYVKRGYEIKQSSL